MTAPGTDGTPAPLVVVTVGTDHHPFDRLIMWVNYWLGQHPDQTAAVFVQSGTTSVVPLCRSSRFLGGDQLGALLDRANVIICHGGPGSIADAWARGQVPIVVPRLRRLGEHVDDHQVDFCRRFNGLGRVLLAETPTAFAELLDEATFDVRRFRASGDERDVEAAVARFAALVDELVSRPRRRRALLDKTRQRRHREKIRAGAPEAVDQMSTRRGAMDRTKWQPNSLSARAGHTAVPREEQQ